MKVKPSRSSNPNYRGRGKGLRFSPYAWAKLIWFRDRGDTEIGGFGVTDPCDPFLVIDFVTVRQHVGVASVQFDDDSVADFFDAQVDLGRQPVSFARLWMHTHPGQSAEPSGTDEDTFGRSFGSCDWSVMFILAKGGATYARLQFHIGPPPGSPASPASPASPGSPGSHAASVGSNRSGSRTWAGFHGELIIPVEVDYTVPFAGVDESTHQAWEAQYNANVHAQSPSWTQKQDDAALIDTDPYLDVSGMDPGWERELDDRDEWELGRDELDAMSMM